MSVVTVAAGWISAGSSLCSRSLDSVCRFFSDLLHSLRLRWISAADSIPSSSDYILRRYKLIFIFVDHKVRSVHFASVAASPARLFLRPDIDFHKPPPTSFVKSGGFKYIKTTSLRVQETWPSGCRTYPRSPIFGFEADFHFLFLFLVACVDLLPN